MMGPLIKFKSDLASILQLGKDCIVVYKWALIFKLSMFFAQIIANGLIPDHKGSMNDVSMQEHRYPDHDTVTETLLGGFDNWDSEYYIYIAQHGYTFLQSMAFFPVYPLLMWLVGRVGLFPLGYLLADRSLFLVAGSLVNMLVFPLAAVALYLLTLHLSNSQRFSIVTVLLFCVNPASVFMSAVYTEALFAFFTFAGLCLLTHSHMWSASFLFSLASATRSNGIVLAGFIAYSHIFRIIYTYTYVSRRNVLEFPVILLSCVVQCTVVVLPFGLFQLYSYWKFCHVPASSGEEVYEWCHWTLPLAYSYIQEHYWNVGFLRYFQLKQIPNFLLALPAVALSCYALYRYGCDNTENLREFKEGYRHRRIFLGYLLHLLFLVGFGVFNMHIQVLTRFLFSSSPLLYWCTARVVCDAVSLPLSLPPSSYRLVQLLKRLTSQLSVHRGQTRLAQLILLYFLAYVALGFLLHCNFYPWT